MDRNDANTHEIINVGHDRISSLLAHFANDPQATWASFGKVDEYLALLDLDLKALALTLTRELQRRGFPEPQDFGT